MIVVDTNVIHYCWVRGQHTEIAQAVRKADPNWHVPILWRSEMRNVLTGYQRRGVLSRPEITRILRHADNALSESEHIIADELVIETIANSKLTAYDAEFVALASALDVPLVTADRAVIKTFPGLALTMEAFLEVRAK
jgi:predicted nucleic acid-binding protein